MHSVLVHAKDDPAAGPVAAALPALLARFVVGQKRPDMMLGALNVILVWNARSAARGEAAFEEMCVGARRLIMVRTDEAVWPAVFANAERLEWRAGGASALQAMLRADPPAIQPRARRLGGLARIAAGLLAAIGVMAPAGAALASTPVAASQGLEPGLPTVERDVVATTSAAETQAAESGESSAIVIDFDARPTPAPYDPQAAATALVEYWAQSSTTMPTPSQVAPIYRAPQFLPGLF